MNLSYGSKGDEVKELQTLLNNNGYNLDVDGDFGTKTLSAVRDYQTKNNLDVDGIVGTNTWGALNKQTSTGTTSQTPTTDTTTAAPTTSKGFEYKPYEKSDVVTQAEALLQQQLNNKPGAYQSTWQDQVNDIVDRILNREKFEYDLNGDALYQQYKDQYVLQGQQAMMDTMGQAAALTGGYGNSYAQSVGQQAYQGYLQQLNDRVPELYQLALSKYQMEGDVLYDQAALMAQQEEQDYGRYQDQMSDYYAELDRLTEDARYQGELDYGKWADGRDDAYTKWLNDQQTAATNYDRLVSMITTLGYTPTDAELQAAGMSREQFQAYKDYYDKLNPTSSGKRYVYDSGDPLQQEDIYTYARARKEVEAAGKDADVYLMNYEDFQEWQKDKSNDGTVSAYHSYEEYLRDRVIFSKTH